MPNGSEIIKLIAPVFFVNNLKLHSEAFNKCAETGLEKIQLQSVDQNKYVYVREFFNLFVLDVLLQCIFSTNENVQTGDTSTPLVNAVMAIVKISCTEASDHISTLAQYII